MAKLCIDETQVSPTVTKCNFRRPWDCTARTELLQIDDVIECIARIDTIAVFYTDVVNEISVFYKLSNGKDKNYLIGARATFRESVKRINFQPEEYITRVSGTIGRVSGLGICVTSIEITTNRDVYGPLGDHTDQLYAFEFRPVGRKIIGFHGNSGVRCVAAIGVYAKEEPLPEEHLRPQLAEEARLTDEARLRQQAEERLTEEAHLRQQAEERLTEEARLRQQAEERLTEEARLRQQAEERLTEEARLRQQAEERLTEEARLRQQAEKRFKSNVNTKFTWFEDSNLPTYDQKKDRLGVGGYGDVYKAVMDTTVAIKILNKSSWQGNKEFNQEIEILGKIRHPNIVSLIGACQKNYALVYEYLPNGSLQELLTASKKKREVLPWIERTKIAACICSTLLFLHKTKPHPIVHGDLKPENILFDSNNVCKLCDFGISRFLEKATTMGTPMHETEITKGTYGYKDPEYVRTRRLTPQSDVFAFGIILLQLVTGEDEDELRHRVLGKIGSLENFIEKSQSHQKEILEQFPDANLEGWPIDEVVKMTSLGIRCSDPAKENRPHLENVVWVGFDSIDS